MTFREKRGWSRSPGARVFRAKMAVILRKATVVTCDSGMRLAANVSRLKESDWRLLSCLWSKLVDFLWCNRG